MDDSTDEGKYPFEPPFFTIVQRLEPKESGGKPRISKPLTLMCTKNSNDTEEAEAIIVFTDRPAAEQYVEDFHPDTPGVGLQPYENAADLARLLATTIEKNPELMKVAIDPWKTETTIRGYSIQTFINRLFD